MNAEALLSRYERIADGPDAVERLRRFVLDLAVRGKLVPQDSADEPATDLLMRIASEKARRVKAGEFREPKSQPSAEEPAYELPASWRWSRLAEIGFISPRVDADDDLLASFVPMTLIAAEVGARHRHEPRKWADIKKGYTHFADGDVGLAKITPCFENGKSAVFRNLTGGIGSGTTELHVVRPVLVDPEYVLLFLKSPQFIENGIPRMTGTAGQKRVPTEYFAYSPFPLPPLAEQHRIVAKVDELMSLCDRLEAARAEREATRDRLTEASLARLNSPDPAQETFKSHASFAISTALPALTTRPDQIKQLRQTILNLAVRGKLVPQNSNDEAPTIKAGHQRSDITGFSRWHAVPLEHVLAESTRNGYSGRPDDAVDGVPILRISAGTVRQDGLVAEEEHKLISGVDQKLRSDYGLRKGDLLACRFNGNKSFVGRLTLFSDYLGIEPIYPDKLIRVRLDRSLAVPEFFQLAGQSDLIRKAIEDKCATTVGNWGISASNLKEILFPLPPLAEQHRIVEKVNELMQLCNQLEASLTHGANARGRLLDILLHEVLAPAKEIEEAA